MTEYGMLGLQFSVTNESIKARFGPKCKHAPIHIPKTFHKRTGYIRKSITCCDSITKHIIASKIIQKLINLAGYISFYSIFN